MLSVAGSDSVMCMFFTLTCNCYRSVVCVNVLCLFYGASCIVCGCAHLSGYALLLRLW